MTTVRMIYVMYIRPARAPDGSDDPDPRLHQQLFVLADDAGHRAVPLWLRIHKGLRARVAQVAQVDGLDRPAGDAEAANGLLETAVRVLRTAGTEVNAVDIEPASDDVPELRWDTVTARVGLATATGPRPATVSAEYGLALAAVTGAPVRVPDAVMDRLAVPVPGEDMRAPFLPPPEARPWVRPWRSRRSEPRNMAFADGLDYWELAAGSSPGGQPAWRTTLAPPPPTSPRSWPPRPRNPPASPSSSRKSPPPATAAARSPSAGSCAPPASTARPGCTWP